MHDSIQGTKVSPRQMEQTCSQNQDYSTRERRLLDLTNFIEDEMTLVNNPLFSREAVRQFEGKSLKPHKPKNIQSYVIKEASGNKNTDTSKCPICEGEHDIEECTTILGQK